MPRKPADPRHYPKHAPRSPYLKGNTEEVAIAAMARAFFVSAWADRMEERGYNFSQRELMDEAPPTPRYALLAATKFAGHLEHANHLNLPAIIYQAAKADGVPDVYERGVHDDLAREFGHYVAMQALGHGVSWFDDHAKFDLKIPHFEFSL